MVTPPGPGSGVGVLGGTGTWGWYAATARHLGRMSSALPEPGRDGMGMGMRMGIGMQMVLHAAGATWPQLPGSGHPPGVQGGGAASATGCLSPPSLWSCARLSLRLWPRTGSCPGAPADACQGFFCKCCSPEKQREARDHRRAANA